MPHETKLLALIAVGFATAMLLGFIAARLRLPPLLGYLVAGIAVGPFTPGFVADASLASELAEIGVILLMFGVGLHFSLDTLKQVRKIALPGAVAQIAVATAIGAALAWWWGWNIAAGLVFGLAMSVASTVVLLRALEQRQELDTQDGRIAVGWLVVEDLAMVLALVFLPALAAATQGEALRTGDIVQSLMLTAFKVAMFFAFMLVVGRRVVPWLLGQIANTGSRELFTLAVLAIALGIAYGSAALFDVSFALGAFFGGVVLAESELSHQAAENSLPLQDAFAVLFFVSVGMLFDPSVIIERPLDLLGVMFVILVGKSLAACVIVMAFGYTSRTALTISASLAQIGEFSFILVALGVSLNLLPPEGRDLILAGALLSITLNPFAFSTVAPLSRWIDEHPRVQRLLSLGRKPIDPLPPEVSTAHLHDHAIIVGYGRVGSVVGEALAAQGLEFVAIESNHRLVELLRGQKVTVVFGNATAHGVLDAARIDKARLLVIATPDGLYTRRILELARRRNPSIAVVVRTHSAGEYDYLIRQGVDRVVMGELELALEMTDYALQRLGVSEARSKLVVQWLRTEGMSGTSGGEAHGKKEFHSGDTDVPEGNAGTTQERP
ncbi:CPA2 family monovalent cation:H+ antiporter-2 [Povalibacter uvarum]|uniref:CPA2 family monovalent cation:H+ antiporter-2 n=1 Tax=Povalibacter uvarum TaxID=732238 RepID=A0A841HLQ1_9GAMM|nr:YbaL family putative K(+) efflux transporter [Povalibacter uvarum]MBB6093289.1 CPA2 family monovalent cation:H+ antiporter-2 [Povalibacter uvarum]